MQDEFAHNGEVFENHETGGYRLHGFEHRAIEVMFAEAIDRLSKAR